MRSRIELRPPANAGRVKSAKRFGGSLVKSRSTLAIPLGIRSPRILCSLVQRGEVNGSAISYWN